MKLKDASFLIRLYSFLMSNNKVQSPLTDMINIATIYIYIYIGNKGLPVKRFGIPLTTYLGILFLIIQKICSS
jgi:hypothetical protein